MATDGYCPATRETLSYQKVHNTGQNAARTQVVFSCGHYKIESYQVYHNFDLNPPLNLPTSNDIIVQPVGLTCLQTECGNTPVDHTAIENAVLNLKSILADLQITLFRMEKELVKTRKGAEPMLTHPIRHELEAVLVYIKHLRSWALSSAERALLPDDCMVFSYSFVAAIGGLQNASQHISQVAETMPKENAHKGDEAATGGQSDGKGKGKERSAEPALHEVQEIPHHGQSAEHQGDVIKPQPSARLNPEAQPFAPTLFNPPTEFNYRSLLRPSRFARRQRWLEDKPKGGSKKRGL